MKRHLLTHLLLVAALAGPAAAGLDITEPFSGDYSSGTPSDVVTVTDSGQITGGTQQITGNNSVFSLQKSNSISGGTQIVGGTGSRFEIFSGNAITGGTQVLQNGATFDVNYSFGVSGGSLAIGTSSTVTISADNAIDSAAITFNAADATLQFGGGHFISVGQISSGGPSYGNIVGAAGASLWTEFSGTSTYSGVISGPLDLYKAGDGMLVLSNTNNSYVGTTFIRRRGGIEFNSAAVFGDAANEIVLDRGTLRWSAGNTDDISSRLYIDRGGATIDTNGNSVTFASVLDGEGGELVKVGSGTLRLTAADAHSGDTTVNGGALVLSGPASAHGQLGGKSGSSITITSGRIDLDGDNVLVGTNPFSDHRLIIEENGLLSTVNSTNILPQTVIVGGTKIETTGTGNFTSGNYIFTNTLEAIATENQDVRITGGAIVLQGAVEVSGTLRIESRIIGDNDLVKDRQGTLVLSNTNTFTGNLIANGGLIEFSGAASLGDAANKIVLNGGGLRWASGNTLDISNRLNPLGEGGGRFDTNGNNVTLTSSITGTGSVIKEGAGTLRLAAANTYEGITLVSGGTLVAAHDNALGLSSSVFVEGGASFQVEDMVAFSGYVGISDGTYVRQLTGDLTGKMNTYSALADVGNRNITARILAGSVGATSTLVSSFSATSLAVNDDMRRSVVYHLAGTGTNTFVLQLDGGLYTEDAMLGWLDGNNEWVNAVDGNTGNTATEAMLDFQGTYADFLTAFSEYSLSETIGAYGFDVGTQTAWAVLNHNSDFAIIPEPGTAGLVVLGGVALMARRRRA